MSQAEPKEPYYYQPEPANSKLYPRLWSIAGPETDCFEGIRLEKIHAIEMVNLIKLYLVYKKFFFEHTEREVKIDNILNGEAEQLEYQGNTRRQPGTSGSKIVPLFVWNKLMLWCDMMAKEHRRDLETLNCDDLLNEILADIEDEEKRNDAKKEG